MLGRELLPERVMRFAPDWLWALLAVAWAMYGLALLFQARAVSKALIPYREKHPMWFYAVIGVSCAALGIGLARVVMSLPPDDEAAKTEALARALKRQEIPEAITLYAECGRSYPPSAVPGDRQMGTVFVSEREDRPFVYFAPSFDWRPNTRLEFPGFDTPLSVLHCRLTSDLALPLFNVLIAVKSRFQISLLVPDGKGGFTGGERSPTSHIVLPIARLGARDAVSLYLFNESDKILEMDLVEEGSTADVGSAGVTRPIKFVRRMEEARPFSLIAKAKKE